MATIRLSFMEGIDRKNNTNAKFRSPFACLVTRQVTFQFMGEEWRVAADCSTRQSAAGFLTIVF
jgi:hypothetical protein